MKLASALNMSRKDLEKELKDSMSAGECPFYSNNNYDHNFAINLLF